MVIILPMLATIPFLFVSFILLWLGSLFTPSTSPRPNYVQPDYTWLWIIGGCALGGFVMICGFLLLVALLAIGSTTTP